MHLNGNKGTWVPIPLGHSVTGDTEKFATYPAVCLDYPPGGRTSVMKPAKQRKGREINGRISESNGDAVEQA